MAKKDEGAFFPEETDIESLITVLKEIEVNTHPRRDGNIPKTPQYEDFTKNLGNLDLIVPMGFVMLHNDLEELIRAYKKNGSLKVTTNENRETTTKFNVAGAIGAVAGLAGVIGGSAIVASLTKDMTLKDVANVAMSLGDWVLTSIPVIAENVAYLINTVVPSITKILPTVAEAVTETVGEVGRGLAVTALDVDDIISDNEVASQRKSLLKTYINLNYAQLFETLGYEAIIDNDGNITGIQRQQVTNYFSGLADDASLGEIAKTGVKSALNNALNTDNIGEAVGETVGGLKAGFRTSQIKAYSDLIEEELPQMLLTVTGSLDIATDSDLRAIAKEANGYYIQAYYGNLIAKMGFSVDYEKGTVTRGLDWTEFYSEAKTLIGDVLTGGVSLGIKAVTESISSSISTIMASMSSLEAIGQDNSEVIKKAYGMYIKAYYGNLIAEMGFEVDYENGTVKRSVNAQEGLSIAKELIGTTTTAGLLGAGIETFVNSISNSLSTLMASFTSLEAVGQDNSEVIKEAYGMYIKAYYANLIAGYGYSVDFESGTLTREESFESIKNTIINTVGDVIFAPISMISNAIGGAITAISSSITDAGMEAELKQGIIDYVNKVYLTATGMDEAVNNLKGFVSQFYKGLYDQILENPDSFKLDVFERDTLRNGFANSFKNLSVDLNKQLAVEYQNTTENLINSAFTEEKVKTLLNKMDNLINKVGGIYQSVDVIKEKETIINVPPQQTQTVTENNNDMANVG